MTDLSRRHALGFLGALSAFGSAPLRAEEAAGVTLGPFDPEMTTARAHAHASAPYAAPLTASSGLRFDYRLYRCAPSPAEVTFAPVVATRTGARVFEDGWLFTIDYAPHPALGDDPVRLEARVNTSAGETSGHHLQANPATRGLRPDFSQKVDVPRAELRAELCRVGQRVAEVWPNRWVGT